MAKVKLVICERASTSCSVSSGCDALPVFPNVLMNEVFLVKALLVMILMEFCVFW